MESILILGYLNKAWLLEKQRTDHHRTAWALFFPEALKMEELLWDPDLDKNKCQNTCATCKYYE